MCLKAMVIKHFKTVKLRCLFAVVSVCIGLRMFGDVCLCLMMFGQDASLCVYVYP